MADTPRSRRPAGRRPKRLAGHGRPTDPVEPEVEADPPEDDEPEPPTRSSSLSRRPEEDLDELDHRTDDEPEPPPRSSSLSRRPEEELDELDHRADDEPEPPTRSSSLSRRPEEELDELDHRADDEPEPPRRRRPVALLVLVLLLLAVVVGEGIYLLSEPDPPDTISAERPVVLDPLESQAVVDQAASDVVTIVSGSSETFDEDVDRATALMTEDFATSYRETKDDVRRRWLAQRVQVTAQVSAQGVVRADADQVEALLFLTQATTKGDGAPTLVQYRVVATMVDTDDGWLVSKLQTF